MKKSNYIAGQWVEGTSSIKNINPSDTSETIDEYTSCTDEPVSYTHLTLPTICSV